MEPRFQVGDIALIMPGYERWFKTNNSHQVYLLGERELVRVVQILPRSALIAVESFPKPLVSAGIPATFLMKVEVK